MRVEERRLRGYGDAMSRFLITNNTSHKVNWVFENGILTKGNKPKPRPRKPKPDEDTHDRRRRKSAEQSIVGKTVFFKTEGIETMLAGVVSRAEGGVAAVKLCLPNTDGVLVMSQTDEMMVPFSDLNVFDAQVIKNANVKAYSGSAEVKLAEKAVEVRDAEGKLEDYRDVTFEGMASTFRSVTPEDRDGDYIMEGAFTKWIGEFRRNPVLLTDHTRRVGNLMGYYSKVGVIQGRGLSVEGMVTNSPHPDARHVRFQLVEGALKTLSIGGSFFYMDDMRGIEEVRLHEISLVVIPANPDAMITTRPVTAKHAESVMKMHLSQNGGELRSSIRKSLT